MAKIYSTLTTRGRFVSNEKQEMSQRHVCFNVNELALRAAEVVGAKICVNIAKYRDSMYNKSMLLTMNDDSRVVAKVPNPNASLPYWTTASEVVTIDFQAFGFCILLTYRYQVRNILDIPVPKVLA
ncbi:hypothetical protein GGP41_003881 [Bipolaris sorokiniana]|uniref:Uncharacterized protein n=1 Tax=Cochliobolus sativus TaxID=45130 RepID=A0A8H5ZBT9_COCSA|nr:hypothetical protein GGP41_003881 [Bipolaris sorokiniana]